MDEVVDKRNKKPFNKKEWRKKKYSNQYKVKKWEERRQKAVVRSYFKEIIKDKSNSKTITNVQPQKKMSAYQAAKCEFNKINEEKKKRFAEISKKKEEIKEALKEYRKKKCEKFKKLSKKNKRGQPVMKDRIQMLYEKVQDSIK
uniref:Uncharacterized protein n=1 Tax=Clastoptera arizonana TaxID=38151 RepID=A0A1B6CCI9_9HEMI